MLTLRLECDGKPLLSFTCNDNTPSPSTTTTNKAKLAMATSNGPLVCSLKFVDQLMMSMLNNSDSLLYSSVIFTISNEHIENASKVILSILQISPDMRFFYTDNNTKEEYILLFDSSPTKSNIILAVRFIKLAMMETDEKTLEQIDQKITNLELKKAEFKDLEINLTKQHENLKIEIERLEKEENQLSIESDKLNKQILESKNQLNQSFRTEELVRSQMVERDKYTKQLQSLTKEQATKRREVIDGISKRFEALRADTLSDVTSQLQTYIEKERLFKSSLKSSLNKQTAQDATCKK